MQKGINLNANVFVSKFYPGLRDRLAQLRFGFTIIGPAAARPYVLTRKALKTGGGKNWRLNGELIGDPPDEPGRFATLAVGDIAILAFEGVEEPQQVVMVLLSATADSSLHAAAIGIAGFQGRDTMRAIEEPELRGIMERTRGEYPGVHPLESLLVADSVEEAIYGSEELQEAAVQTDGRGIAIAPESVRRQAMNAGETGQLGEEAFERWLIDSGHSETDYEWVSQTYGRAAFDFDVTNSRWETAVESLHIDVKATRGEHDSPLHMSMAELRWAAAHPGYRIARISMLTTNSAGLRILANVTEVASEILEGLEEALPERVKIDSVAIHPSLFREVHAGNIEWATEE